MHIPEQAPHALQLPTQSTGHVAVLHVCVDVLVASAPYVTEHVTPPAAAGVDTANVRTAVPSPHVGEHASHTPQLPTQSTGHSTVLHSALSTTFAVAEHAAPPELADVDTANVRYCAPPPHVTEQAPHASQLPTQSTGHATVLHRVLSTAFAVAEQAAPLELAGVDTANARYCVPPPHVREHALHAPQLPTQSTGHSAVLHKALSTVFAVAEHAAPPELAGVDNPNVRDCVPLPQYLNWLLLLQLSN